MCVCVHVHVCIIVCVHYCCFCYVYTWEILFCSDRDECDEFDTLCNPGTCTNIVNGGFYDCTCTDGFMENGGDASLLELGCEGK